MSQNFSTLHGFRIEYVKSSRKMPIRPPVQRNDASESPRLTCGLDVQNEDHASLPLGEGGSTGAAIGCFVKVLATGEIGFVSTNLGIAALNRGERGDRIVRLDGDPKRVIGTLREWIPLIPLPTIRRGVDDEPKNHYSMALAILEPEYEYYANHFPPDREAPPRKWPLIQGCGRAMKGDIVCKYTLDGQFSVGKVVSLDQHLNFPITEGGPLYRFDGIFEIESIEGHFDGSGDAGTLVVRRSDGLVLGMIFATGEATNHVWGFPIESGLRQLGCELILPGPHPR